MQIGIGTKFLLKKLNDNFPDKKLDDILLTLFSIRMTRRISEDLGLTKEIYTSGYLRISDENSPKILVDKGVTTSTEEEKKEVES